MDDPHRFGGDHPCTFCFTKYLWFRLNVCVLGGLSIIEQLQHVLPVGLECGMSLIRER